MPSSTKGGKHHKASASRKNSALTAQAEAIERDLNLIRAAMRQPADAEFAKGHLTGPQRAVMHVLVTTPDPIPQRDLRKQVGLAQSTVSGIVNRLVKQGFIETRPDPADSRSTLLQPSIPVRDFMQRRLPQLTRSPLIAALSATDDRKRARIAKSIRTLRDLLTPPSTE
jgi:DNA-binding MarR family transcriptional regulator